MPRRSYAETPGCGLRIHIILQAASVFGAATVIDLYLRDVYALGSGDVKVCAIILGGVIPCLFGFFGGRYADAAWAVQRPAHGILLLDHRSAS